MDEVTLLDEMKHTVEKILMNYGHISAAFSRLIEEFEIAVHEINKEGAEAFEEKRYDVVPQLSQKAKDVIAFQSNIVEIESKWASFAEPSREQVSKKGKWTKQTSPSPADFHGSCVDKASQHLNVKFTKQTRTSFVSEDGQIALVVSVSKEHENGRQKFCWYSFHPYQGEFLASKPRGYLLLGCASPDKILLIPFSDFLPWVEKLNKSIREDESYYSHIRIVTDGGNFRLKLEGRGNQVDVGKYHINTK